MPLTEFAAVLAVVAWIILLPRVADARGPLTDDPDSMFNQVPEDSGISYATEITGIEDGSLLERLEAASQLVGLQDRPPPTLVALERRVRSDLDRLKKVLRSEGYYGERLTYRMETESVPALVYVDVVTGPRYLLEHYTISYSGPGSEDADLPRDPAGIGVTLGEPARAEIVAGARQRLTEALANIGHPLAKIVDQSAVVDHAKHSMSVTIEVAPGQQARFGPVKIAGTDNVEADYIESFIPWKQGEIFDRRKINAARQQLLDTGLFAAVAFERPNTLDASAELPVIVRVEERKHRSVGLGGRWSTDEGFSVEAGWEHRNILGAAQKVDVNSRFSEVRQHVNAEFEFPAFVTPKNRLVMEASAGREMLDSYDAKTLVTGLRIEHELTPEWIGTAGTRFKYSLINDTGDTENFGLLSFPLQLKWDTTDDILNPKKGWTVLGRVVPYVDMLNTGISFVNTSLSGSIYCTFESLFWTPTLALRGAVGSISGEVTRTIPADERFYVGGGGSVRGYPYQTLSELEDEDPVGGNSFQEVSIETRFLVGENWGFVTFMDGGYAFEEATQQVDQELLWGAGVGFRYYTVFAPIRVDVAVPLNKREGVDDDFQLYISIGQAF